ncbi:MAG: monooxygenase, partial [Actinomycetia bacterium]|nr:monooxygenase [Actinomycetes bacterium]
PPASAGAAHPLAGARLPRGRVTRTNGTTARLYDLFHNGRFVLLEAAAPEGNGATARDGGGPDGTAQDAAANGLPDQVRRVVYTRCTGTRLPAAALVRPDGYVAWASDEPDPQARARAARAAARWWCG